MIITVMLLLLRYKNLWQQVAIVLLMAVCNGQYVYSHLRGLIMQNSTTFKADMTTGKLTMRRQVGYIYYDMILKTDPRKDPVELQKAKRNIEAEMVRSFGVDAIINEAIQCHSAVVDKQTEKAVQSVDDEASLKLEDLQQELIKERTRSILSIIWRRATGWNR